MVIIDGIQYIKGDNLPYNINKITFYINGGRIILRVANMFDDYFLVDDESDRNDIIFDLLKIEDKNRYIENIVGYCPYQGSFPTVNGVGDLKLIIMGLINTSMGVTTKYGGSILKFNFLS